MQVTRMEKYEIELYEKEDGNCPVAEFLDKLEPKMWAKVTRNIDVLSEHNLRTGVHKRLSKV